MNNGIEPKLISGNSNIILAKEISRRISMHRGISMELVNAYFRK